MSKIKVLSKHLAELIAAGEVVERPASAVKEMLENSIDSGADKIVVKISCGGIGLIQITDNGSGIEKEDVKKAFMKNATSKLKTEEDLFKISTLGFRGEALASICAVSKVEMVTKAKNEKYGTHYKIVGGEEVLFEEGSCPVGTTIVIKDLFFNVPARMKFLKSNSYEGNLVSKIVEKVALSHPEVNFKLFKDKKEELNAPGDGKVESAIYSICGKTFLDSLVPLRYEDGNLKISGYITKPECSSASRNSQIFFINKRYVKSNIIKTALEESYKGLSMIGKFPSCVLYLDLPFDFLDVNVHPAKTEVKFNNDKLIYNLVYYAAKNALNSLNSSFVFPANTYNHVSNISFLQSNKIQKKDKDLVNLENNILNKHVKNVPYFHTASSNLYQNRETMNGFSENIKNNLHEEEKKVEVYKTNTVVNRSGSSFKKNIYNNGVEKLLVNSDFNNFKLYKENKYLETTAPSREHASIAKDSIFSKNGDPSACNDQAKEENSDFEKNKSCKVGQQQILPKFKEKENLLLEDNNLNEEEQNEKLLKEKIDKKLIGEAFKTYIILQISKDKILFIDKHAAHERLLYEKLITKKHKKEDNQMLLEPIALALNNDEYSATLKNKDIFLDLGFLIEDFGKNMIIVRSAPLWIEKKDIKSTVMDLISDLLENKKEITAGGLDWIYKNIACRAAVKANDVSSREELITLILNIKKNNIKYCPHGRPVYFTLNKLDIEKKFFRK